MAEGVGQIFQVQTRQPHTMKSEVVTNDNEDEVKAGPLGAMSRPDGTGKEALSTQKQLSQQVNPKKDDLLDWQDELERRQLQH